MHFDSHISADSPIICGKEWPEKTTNRLFAVNIPSNRKISQKPEVLDVAKIGHYLLPFIIVSFDFFKGLRITALENGLDESIR